MVQKASSNLTFWAIIHKIKTFFLNLKEITLKTQNLPGSKQVPFEMRRQVMAANESRLAQAVLIHEQQLIAILLLREKKSRRRSKRNTALGCIIIIIIYPLTARVVGAPHMILQQVFSIFPCSPLPSGTCRTLGLSIP